MREHCRQRRDARSRVLSRYTKHRMTFTVELVKLIFKNRLTPSRRRDVFVDCSCPRNIYDRPRVHADVLRLRNSFEINDSSGTLRMWEHCRQRRDARSRVLSRYTKHRMTFTVELVKLIFKNRLTPSRSRDVFVDCSCPKISTTVLEFTLIQITTKQSMFMAHN